jgi:site-specific DNA recombinase
MPNFKGLWKNTKSDGFTEDKNPIGKELCLMAYVAYLRKSRMDIEAEARGEGDTLSRHRVLLADTSRRLKLPISDYYAEIVSGETISSRPVMQKLLSEVEQGLWQGVFVVEVERLARGDTIDQGIVAQAFKYSNTKIITPIKIYDPNNEFDEEYFEFGLFMSRREYKTINRRLQTGRLASVNDGKYVGNKPPYGYDRVKIQNDKGYTLSPNGKEAEAVQKIFDWYAYGMDGEKTGSKRIADALDAMGYPTRSGKPWSQHTVLTILRNPVYTGKVKWNARHQVKSIVNGEMVKTRPRAKSGEIILKNGLHPALVDQKTFDIVQEILKKTPPTPAPKDRPVQNPLAGLVFCANCGKKMVRRPYQNGRVSTLLCPNTKCNTVSADLYAVEATVIQEVKKFLETYRLQWQDGQLDNDFEKQLDQKNKAITACEKELSKLSEQMNRQYDLLEQGAYTVQIFEQRSKHVSQQIEVQKQKMETLQQELIKIQKGIDAKNNVIPRFEDALRLYYATDSAAEKNRILKSIVEKVVYSKHHNGRWKGDPHDFDVVVYPKLYAD